jgi:hypothetical protein
MLFALSFSTSLALGRSPIHRPGITSFIMAMMVMIGVKEGSALLKSNLMLALGTHHLMEQRSNLTLPAKFLVNRHTGH